MRNRHIAAVTILAALSLSLVPVATADDGRDGNEPGTPVPAGESVATVETGNDQDGANTRDIVHADDVIIDGSLCVGFDCYSAYSFGYDTIVLRENNLRILFDDTSTAASYPNNDWRILINQSDNGGQEYFAIEDATGGRTIFKLKAGAPANAISVDQHGRVGFGTGNPYTELHSVDSDTPTIRMEQDGSGGWTPQTWDLAGNESNFFIRDVTHGSSLVFRIKPGSETDSIYIGNDHQVGFGTSSPDASIHVEGGTGDTQILIEETSGTASQRQLIQMVNNGGAQFSFNNGTVDWRTPTSTPKRASNNSTQQPSWHRYWT